MTQHQPQHWTTVAGKETTIIPSQIHKLTRSRLAWAADLWIVFESIVGQRWYRYVDMDILEISTPALHHGPTTFQLWSRDHLTGPWAHWPNVSIICPDWLTDWLTPGVWSQPLLLFWSIKYNCHVHRVTINTDRYWERNIFQIPTVIGYKPKYFQLFLPENIVVLVSISISNTQLKCFTTVMSSSGWF